MLYCSTHRIDSLASASFFLAEFAPASGVGRSTITKANASGWKISDCRLLCVAIVALTLPVACVNVICALLAGDALTVCNGPLVMMDGLMFQVPEPAPATGDVSTNVWISPVSM